MDKWDEIEARRQRGCMTQRDAYDVLRRHLDHEPGDGQVDEYEALDVLWSAADKCSNVKGD